MAVAYILHYMPYIQYTVHCTVRQCTWLEPAGSLKSCKHLPTASATNGQWVLLARSISGISAAAVAGTAELPGHLPKQAYRALREGAPPNPSAGVAPVALQKQIIAILHGKREELQIEARVDRTLGSSPCSGHPCGQRSPGSLLSELDSSDTAMTSGRILSKGRKGALQGMFDEHAPGHLPQQCEAPLRSGTCKMGT